MKTSPLLSTSEIPQQMSFRSSPMTWPTASAFALVMQAEAGCIERCVGSTAATQCSYCGNDFACWESCAGVGRGGCVSNCFN